jgi:hypothetical protein
MQEQFTIKPTILGTPPAPPLPLVPNPLWRREAIRHGAPGGPGLVSVFGSATNVWAIGLIMVCLTQLEYGHIDGGEGGLEGYDPVPFQPTFRINGAMPRGRTYCPSLQAENYSNELKGLIFECLYEIPSHRPTIQAIKGRIGEAVEFITALPAEPEESFDTF